MLFVHPIFLSLIYFATFFTVEPKKLRKLGQKEVKFGDDNAKKFHSRKCAFFCFFVPLEGRQMDQMIDLSFHEQLSCSDIVYGFALVEDFRLQLPTRNDLIPSSSFGNFRLITALQQLRHGPQVLLGIKQAPRARFLQNAELTRNVSQRIVFHARRYGFSGIFLKFDSEVLLSPGFEHFVDTLGAEVKKDAEMVKRKKLTLVLSISAHWTRYVWRQMAKFDTYFDTFYLWADETKSVEQLHPTQAVPVDPAWTRSYELSTTVLMLGAYQKQDSEEEEDLEQYSRTKREEKEERKRIGGEKEEDLDKGVDSEGLVPQVDGWGPPGKLTNQSDGHLALQEFCVLRRSGQMNYENASETLSFVEGKVWYSNNEPGHDSFLHKLNWIRDHKFGGVGLYSIQADDPDGTCSLGPFPLHRSLGSHFKCQAGSRRGARAQNGACMRLCMVDLEREVTGKVDFAKLGHDWCSHLLLASAKMNAILRPTPTKGLERAVKMYDEWEQDGKPFMVISFTGTAEQWRLATLSLARLRLIEQIRAVADSFNADGIDINCSNGGPDLPIFVTNFGRFLAELRRKMPHTKIFLTIAPSSFGDNPNYDYESLDKSVDYFVAVGYRFHQHNNPHTGHHSPMFGSHDLLTQPRMTIQGMTEDMVHGHIPPEKAMAMRFAEDLAEDTQNGDRDGRLDWENHRIGEPASMVYGTMRNRALQQGVVTQTELCGILKEPRVHSRFVSDLAVPYLVNKDNEFIAFDNKRSIQIKTVWISLNGFAGIALHGVELDNVDGECPQNESFPILRQIVETQMCSKCSIANVTVPSDHDSTVSSTSVNTKPATSMSSQEEFIAEAISAYGGQMEKPPGAAMPKVSANSEAPQTQKSDAPNEKCQSNGRFSLYCAHNLSTNIANDLLTTEICDSLLVFDRVELTSDGTIKVSGEAEEWMAKFGKNGIGKRQKLWVELNCSMASEEWAKLLKENRHKLVESLDTFFVRQNLSGIVLNCDGHQTGEVREEFTKLLDELKEKSEAKRADSGECAGIRLAFRLPLRRSVLSEAYNVKALNRHSVTVLLDAGMAFSKQKTRLLNPLYAVGIAQKAETQTQNTTLAAWLSEGLNAAQVVLELPAFGLLQKRETDEQAEPKRIGRAEICKFQQKAGGSGRTQYDAVCSYWDTGDEWVSNENAETVKYKVHWAIARRLGGVLIRALDDDDPSNACKKGAFPLLHAMHEARCRLKKSHVVMRDLMGMHMSRG
uniref:GH18 domain-containing protein n=1 Tax=Globodera rostochiensis TaxID=31243 RepID=A0A914I8Q1_GLORO